MIMIVMALVMMTPLLIMKTMPFVLEEPVDNDGNGESKNKDPGEGTKSTNDLSWSDQMS